MHPVTVGNFQLSHKSDMKKKKTPDSSARSVPKRSGFVIECVHFTVLISVYKHKLAFWRQKISVFMV